MKEEIYKLNNVGPDDMGDVLVKIQRSFNIELDIEGLKDVHTFGNLCDVIIHKINLTNSDNCTTQQAFYKLRNAIANVTGIDKCIIKPQTTLSEVFPKENRHKAISEVENELGLKLNLLQPHKWIVGLFALMLAGSLIECFYNWMVGITGLISSIISLKLSGKFGKEIHLKTVGDLATKISRESYLRSRRNTCPINKNEIEQRVKELFIHDMDLEPIVLTRETRFN